MKAFKFTLKALLNLREQQERSALQDYGQKLNAQERAVSNLESARHQLEEARAALQRRHLEGCCADALWQCQSWCDAMEKRVFEFEHAAETARRKARHSFSRLLSARHATGIMQKLLEEQRKGQRREQRHHESKARDRRAESRQLIRLLTEAKHPSYWN